MNKFEQNIETNSKRRAILMLDTTDTEDEVVVPSRPKKLKSEESDDYKKFLSNANIRDHLSGIATTDKMILVACQNIRNRENIHLMEWSECVFIQLCTVKKPVKYLSMSWSELKNFVENCQWSIEVVHNLKKYIDNITLLSLLENNHAYKVKNHNLDINVAFVTRPRLDYKLLKSYKLTLNIITQPPVFTNRLPAKFKKMNL